MIEDAETESDTRSPQKTQLASNEFLSSFDSPSKMKGNENSPIVQVNEYSYRRRADSPPFMSRNSSAKSSLKKNRETLDQSVENHITPNNDPQCLEELLENSHRLSSSEMLKSRLLGTTHSSEVAEGSEGQTGTIHRLDTPDFFTFLPNQNDTSDAVESNYLRTRLFECTEANKKLKQMIKGMQERVDSNENAGYSSLKAQIDLFEADMSNYMQLIDKFKKLELEADFLREENSLLRQTLAKDADRGRSKGGEQRRAELEKRACELEGRLAYKDTVIECLRAKEGQNEVQLLLAKQCNAELIDISLGFLYQVEESLGSRGQRIDRHGHQAIAETVNSLISNYTYIKATQVDSVYPYLSELYSRLGQFISQCVTMADDSDRGSQIMGESMFLEERVEMNQGNPTIVKYIRRNSPLQTRRQQHLDEKNSSEGLSMNNPGDSTLEGGRDQQRTKTENQQNGLIKKLLEENEKISEAFMNLKEANKSLKQQLHYKEFDKHYY